MKALLSSDRLRVCSENNTIWLLLPWLKEQPVGGQQELARTLMPCLRVQYMDHGYVLMIAHDTFTQRLGIQNYLLSRSVRALLITAGEMPGQQGEQPKSRGIDSIMGADYDVTFLPEDIPVDAEADTTITKMVALVRGLMWAVTLRKEDEEARLAIGPHGVVETDGGMFYTFSVVSSVGTFDMTSRYTKRWTADGDVLHDVGKTWEQVARNGLKVQVQFSPDNHIDE